MRVGLLMRVGLFLIVGFLALVFAKAPSDTLVLPCCAADIDTLDPAGAYDTVSSGIIENLYEGLFTYKGDKVDEYTPVLATSSRISEDGTEYIFDLRTGVFFHSGNPFSCKDAEYSFERALVINYERSGVWFLAESFLGNDGANANDDPSISWQQIDAAIQCLDEFTLSLTILKPEAAFFSKLLYTNTMIIDSVWAIEKGDWSGTELDWRDWVNREPYNGFLHDHASGTGPYKLVAWDSDTLLAQKNEAYWGPDASIDKVLIQNIQDETSSILAFQNADVDILRRGDITRQALESRVRSLANIKVIEDPEFLSNGAAGFFMIQDINTEDNELNIGCAALACGIPSNFFADKNIRLAFSYAFDIEAFINDVELGFATPLTMLLPPFFPGYNPDIQPYLYNPGLAERYFKEAFEGQVWEQGFRMAITYNPNSIWQTNLVQNLKAGIEDLNAKFQITIRPLDFPTRLSERRAGKLAMFNSGWAPDYADSDNFIYTYYHSNGFYGSQSKLKDERLDALIEQARVLDPDTRVELYYEVGQMAHDEAYYIPLLSAQTFIVTQENVSLNYINPMLSGQTLWKDILKD